uniref:cysteine dioxygenase n=1 Tax=Wollemia nobilis TaxID=56998 RepID=A0A0C9RZF6_9CONI
MPTVVQRLYQACNESFPSSSAATAVPSPRAIHRVRSVLDTIKPVDVGFNEELLEDDYGYGFSQPNLQRVPHSPVVDHWEEPITYLHIYECDRFSIGIFCLPMSAVIPFHDHPRMTVFSKLLFGSMHIKAYDWVYPMDAETNPLQVRLAKLKIDNDFTAPCDTTILYPTSGGNIHSFQAVTPCAVLDVLVPPYSDTAGRSCTYYCDYPYASLPDDENTVPHVDSDRGYAWLEETEKRDDFIVEGAQYKGPLIEA